MTSAGGVFAGEIDAISRMARLAHNWDGHGADAAPAPACDQAAQFLHRVAAKFGYQVPPPHVGAVPGGVVLIWRGRKKQREGLERELEIVFTEHGNEWSASERNALEPTMSGEDVDYDTLLKVVDRFIAA